MENQKNKINNITGILMISVALGIDFIQAFFNFILIGPFINWMVSLFAFLTFWFWFTLKGIKFVKNPKNIFVFGGGSIAEFIPFFDFLPIWTSTVTTLVVNNKIKTTIK